MIFPLRRSLRSDRGPLRSQDVFLNFAGRSLGSSLTKVTLCGALKCARLTRDRPIPHRFLSGFAVYPPAPPHGVFARAKWPQLAFIPAQDRQNAERPTSNAQRGGK